MKHRHTTTRRAFLKASLAATLPLAITNPAGAIEPIRRSGKPHLRLSLAAYSFRKYLELKKPSMTLADFADLAASLELDAIEPTAYYFAETTPEYLARLKGRCTRLGLDISGTAVGNNFCHPDPSKVREQIAHVKTWVEHASRLGAKTIRIFAGNVAKGDTEDAARSRCIDAIQEACDYAGKFGIYLALENHGGITATADQILAIVQAVKHDWFGVNLDTGNFHTADPYADLARLAPYAVTVQIKSEIQRAGKANEEADLARLLDILRGVGYRGYVALEYEAAADPKTAVPHYVKELQKLLS
jgi:sugar phosphate isomerase/epimerase